MAPRRRRTGQARSRVGTIGKKAQTTIEGFDELVKNIRRMSDQARVKILTGAVDQGGREALQIMQELAPRAPGSGTRGYHGADRLESQTLFSRRDSRARSVGAHLDRGQWSSAGHLRFAEFGTVRKPGGKPFVRPTARRMRKRMIDITVSHWRKATRFLGGLR